MQQQTLKERPCKNCGKKFQKINPLDYLCSSKCDKEWKAKLAAKKLSNTIKDVELEHALSATFKQVFKKQAPIRKVSIKRKDQNKIYLKKRKEFLSREENKYCPVMKHFQAVDMPATEIHHMNSRNGDRLNDESYWLAVSRVGHNWIPKNPKEARRLGWLI